MFEGFLRAYVEGSDDPEAELADKERLLPSVDESDPLNAAETGSQEPHDATAGPLQRSLADAHAGRKGHRSTEYLRVDHRHDHRQRRNYVYKKGNALVPSWTAFSVMRLMEDALRTLVDYEFTAQMEDFLDSISRHEGGSVEYLRQFYFGDERPASDAIKQLAADHVGLKPRLEKKLEEIDPRVTARFSLGTPTEGEHREEVFVRVGKYGPFLEQGERKASIPEGMPPDEMTWSKRWNCSMRRRGEDEPLGIHPETGKPIYIKVGPFRPYIQLGENDDEEKKNQSLLKGMAGGFDAGNACKLLMLPRTSANYPENDEPIQALRWSLWTVREMRKGNAFAARRRLAPGGHAGGSDRVALEEPKTRGRRHRKNRSDV